MTTQLSKLFLCTICVLFLSTIEVYAQVSISPDGSDPDSTAMLDIKSTTSGILIPRMSSTQRDSITSPAFGLLVFVNNDSSFYFYDGTSWNLLNSEAISDNLGDHKAVQNIELNGNWLSADGDNEGLYIDANGKVGIKTTAPLASLDIKSTASGEQLLRFDTPRPWAFEQNSTGSSTQLILRSESNSKRFCIEAPDGTRAAEFSTINAGASEVYLAPGTGNVGIGTTTPNAKLNVNGEVRITDGNLFRMETGTGLMTIKTVEADNYVQWDVGGAGHFDDAFYIGDISSPTNEVYMLGNVGIGNDTPTEKLDVTGSIRMEDGNQQAGYIPVSDANGTMTWTDPSTITTAADGDGDSNNELQTLSQTGTDVTLSNGGGTISVADNDNSVSNELQTLSVSGNQVSLSNGGGTITVEDVDDDWTVNGNDIHNANSGNIGVGTTSPSQKLDVNGSIKMRAGATAGHIPVSDSSGTMVWTDPAIMNDGDWTINGDDLINGNTGGVGIGITPIPSNNLSVKMGGTGAQSEASHVSAVNYSGAFVIGWQSFTALTNYPVESIELFYKKLNITSSLTMNIYEGQGTSGTLLFTSAPVQRPTDYDRYVVFPVGGVVNLVQGQKYTIQINNQAGWINSGGNGYVDGASHVASRDYKFKVNVTAPYAFNVNNNGVGVNVLIPQEDLDVAGSIRMREGATAGYLPVSDANGTMVWSDPSVVDDEWIVSANGTEGAGYVLTSDSSGNATWQPNDNVDEWIVSANGTEGAGYVLTSDANGNATWKHNRSRLAFIRNSAETIYGDGGGTTWHTMTNWTEWLYVESGDAVSVDANFLYSLIGGSGSNDDVAFRIVFEGQNGCQGGNGISTGRQYDWETFRNQYMPAHVSDVIEALCTGEIRFALQVYTGYTDDDQGVRGYVIKAVRY